MLEKLTEIIREYTGKEDLVIEEDTSILGDLGLSSFDLVQLVCQVEDEFDVEIPDQMIREFRTAGDVIRFLEKQ
jgi:acyl carrier protein